MVFACCNRENSNNHSNLQTIKKKRSYGFRLTKVEFPTPNHLSSMSQLTLICKILTTQMMLLQKKMHLYNVFFFRVVYFPLHEKHTHENRTLLAILSPLIIRAVSNSCFFFFCSLVWFRYASTSSHNGLCLARFDKKY